MDSKLSLNLITNWQGLCCDIVFTDIAALLIQKEIITVNEYEIIVTQPEPSRVQSLLMLLLKKNDEVLLKFANSLEKDYSWLAEKLKAGYEKEESKDEIDASPVIKMDSAMEIKVESKDYDINDQKGSDNTCDGCLNVNFVNKTDRLNNSVNTKSRDIRRGKIMKSRIKNKLKPKITNTTTHIVPPELNEEISDEVIKIVRRCHLVSKSWTTLAHSLGLTDRVNEIRYKVVIHGEDLSMCVVYLIKEWIEMFPKIATLSKLIEVLRGEGFNSVGDKLSEILYKKQINVTSAIH